MANWHARAGSLDGNSFEIIFHIPIPATNNRVGLSFRTALVKSGFGGKTKMTEGVLPGEITTTERAAIAAGSLYEHIEQFDTHPDETATQLQVRIDARYNQLATQLLDRIKNILQYWGHDRNVP
jgi:hypothetical protein